MSRPRIVEFRPLRKGSLLGFATVQFASGLIMREVAVHRTGSKTWCSPPSRPWVRDGAVVIDETTGKPKYQPLIEFSTHGVRSSWSRQILAAIEAHDPAIIREDAAE